MILTAFFMLVFIFMLSAHLAGDVRLFINIDSLLIILAGVIIFTIGTGRIKPALRGLREMISFSFAGKSRDEEVKNLFSGLCIASIAVGICSTIQGFISGVLLRLNYSVPEILSYASFTTLYGIMFAVFLFFPVYLRNR